MKTVSVLSTPCLAVDSDELGQMLDRYAASEQVAISCDFTNTHIVTMRHVHRAFSEITVSVDFFIPDSRILVWAMRMLGTNAGCHYGPRFMRAFILSRKNARHYLLGGEPECLNRLVNRFRAAGVNITGFHHGYFQATESGAIVNDLNTLSPDFIWVGLGTPLQQEWINRHKPFIRRGVLMAIGYAFDVNAGTKPDAPLWMHHAGLGWIYRLMREPRRLWRRYLVYNSVFTIYFIRKSAGSCYCIVHLQASSRNAFIPGKTYCACSPPFLHI